MGEGVGRGAKPRGGGRVRVAVVGGGLAGIAAALSCADGGAEVTLVEVRPRLGGAAYSFERDGMLLDNGQHVFLRCCTAYRALLERLGTSEATTMQERLTIPVIAPGGRVEWLRRDGLPAPLHLAGSLARYGHLSLRERARAARAALRLSQLDLADEDLDARTFGAWLEEHGQSPAATESLWNLIALPTLNLRAEEASLAMAAFVFQTGLLHDPAAGDVGYARRPLSAIHGEPSARALRAAGVEIRTGWRAERIEAGPSGEFTVRGADDEVSADSVIVALPPARAAGVLPEGTLDDPARLDGLGTSPIVNLHIVYDGQVTDFDLAAGVRSPVQWIFDRTRESGASSGQHLAISLSGAGEEARMGRDELYDRYVPALRELLPRARDARIERFEVVREHNATFRAAPRVNGLRPAARTRIDGLALAGAWTATGWPATMEGAVRSGLTAARQALRLRDRAPLAEVAA
ncbi:MAG: hydroxysqualene dehydroxylase HpnE [Solirubrobacterales bacterium]